MMEKTKKLIFLSCLFLLLLLLWKAFCYRFPINVPIGALNFDFEFPLCLPDLSGLEGVLKILNGDFTALLDLLNL